MKRCALIALLCATLSRAQDARLIPHPYLTLGTDFSGSSGYQPVSPFGSAGLSIDSEHFLLDLSGSYESTRKVNDNTGSNPKGRQRGLLGNASYRFSSQWFLGVGASWDQLSTTNYSKQNWHPRFGGGRDFFTRDCSKDGCRHDFTARFSVAYVLRGSDWMNGVQGPTFALEMPSPSARRHFFFREGLQVYRFHNTVTDRTDPVLTGQESSVHHVSGDMDTSIIYRF